MRRKLVATLILVGVLVLIAGCNGNKRPTAAFSYEPHEGQSPLTVDFDASSSYDPDGDIVAYDWDFGDGTTGSGEQTSHTFVSETDRTFTVRLAVTDDHGATDSARGSVSVDVGSPGPTLFFDDFEDGLDPAWNTSPGWSVSDGWLYTAPIGWRYAYVLDGSHWSNYAVDVDVDPRSSTMAIIFRCSEDLQDYVTMEASINEIRWRVFRDREEIEASDPISPGLFEGVNHVRAEAYGNQYRVYVEGFLRLQYTYSGYSQGMPGLAGVSNWYNAPGSGVDNYRVTELE